MIDVVEEQPGDGDHQFVLVRTRPAGDDVVFEKRRVPVDEREGNELRDRSVDPFLKLPDPFEVHGAVGLVFDVAVHDRRRESEADARGGFHRLEPLVGPDLAGTDHLANLLDEDFGGRSGNRIQPPRLQSPVDLLVGPVGAATGVVGLLGSHRVDVDVVDAHRGNLCRVGPGIGLVAFGWLVVDRFRLRVGLEHLEVFLVERERGVESGDRTHLVDPSLDRVGDDFARLCWRLGEPCGLDVGIALEGVGGVLEVTEETADVTGRRNVVVQVRDEGDLLADDVGAATVGRLEHQFLAPAVDPLDVRSGRE